ncbi:PrsW family intramembrane metalloprotease [Carbonactinospora thermoautotrophica]|uniref:PrsW family intramembrane metalloprotease n=1 Tax=Carbonactinospora thermoautotrophica TaxID=1469144 RepID=UPI00082BD5BD|nr:PrsW family intramembrane metalloprotease [Carbonactinospora thermoautotrophica]
MSVSGPYRPARSANAQRVLKWVAITAVFLIGFLYVMAVIVGGVGVAPLFIGLPLAILPVPVVIATFMWLDRLEPEPIGFLVFAFGWGAGVATFLAIFLNQGVGALLGVPGTLVAPFAEEAVKGLGLLVFVLLRRREFDGVVDGIVLGGIIGAGFAFTENILYISTQFAELGVGGAVGQFLLRGVFRPFAHPLYTSLTGIGLGVAVTTRNPALKVLAPVGGWSAGVLLHLIWNGSGYLPISLLVTYVLVMVPVFVGWVALIRWSRRMELKVLERHLPAYAAAGWIANWELPALCTFPGRKRARDWAKRTLGDRGKRAMIDLQLAATELAFLREKASRGQDLHDFSQREQQLLGLLSARKQILQPAAAQQPFGTAPIPTQPSGGPPPPVGPLSHPDGVSLPPPGPSYPPSGYPGVPPQDSYRTP